jgi:hypothetical protein
MAVLNRATTLLPLLGLLGTTSLVGCSFLLDIDALQKDKDNQVVAGSGGAGGNAGMSGGGGGAGSTSTGKTCTSSLECDDNDGCTIDTCLNDKNEECGGELNCTSDGQPTGQCHTAPWVGVGVQAIGEEQVLATADVIGKPNMVVYRNQYLISAYTKGGVGPSNNSMVALGIDGGTARNVDALGITSMLNPPPVSLESSVWFTELPGNTNGDMLATWIAVPQNQSKEKLYIARFRIDESDQIDIQLLTVLDLEPNAGANVSLLPTEHSPQTYVFGTTNNTYQVASVWLNNRQLFQGRFILDSNFGFVNNMAPKTEIYSTLNGKNVEDFQVITNTTNKSFAVGVLKTSSEPLMILGLQKFPLSSEVTPLPGGISAASIGESQVVLWASGSLQSKPKIDSQLVSCTNLTCGIQPVGTQSLGLQGLWPSISLSQDLSQMLSRIYISSTQTYSVGNTSVNFGTILVFYQTGDSTTIPINPQGLFFGLPGNGNSTAVGTPHRPRVASTPDGHFGVTWVQQPGSGSPQELRFKSFKTIQCQ